MGVDGVLGELLLLLVRKSLSVLSGEANVSMSILLAVVTSVVSSTPAVAPCLLSVLIAPPLSAVGDGGGDALTERSICRKLGRENSINNA